MFILSCAYVLKKTKQHLILLLFPLVYKVKLPRTLCRQCPLHEPTVLKAPAQNNILTRIHHYLHIFRIGGACDMVVDNLFIGVFVDRQEEIEKVFDSGIEVAKHAFVVRELGDVLDILYPNLMGYICGGIQLACELLIDK